MICNDIDFITRNGHSDAFKREVKSIFESIDLRVSGTPKLVFYISILASDFNRDNSWYRIPCESRTVYCKKINDFWKDKYEIAYKTKLGIYGDEHERSFYRVLRIEYDDIFSDAYSSDAYSRALREQLRRINRELLNTERTVRL